MTLRALAAAALANAALLAARRRWYDVAGACWRAAYRIGGAA